MKTKPASWEVEENREKSLTKEVDKDKEKPVVVRRTPVVSSPSIRKES